MPRKMWMYSRSGSPVGLANDCGNNNSSTSSMTTMAGAPPQDQPSAQSSSKPITATDREKKSESSQTLQLDDILYDMNPRWRKAAMEQREQTSSSTLTTESSDESSSDSSSSSVDEHDALKSSQHESNSSTVGLFDDQKPDSIEDSPTGVQDFRFEIAAKKSIIDDTESSDDEDDESKRPPPSTTFLSLPSLAIPSLPPILKERIVYMEHDETTEIIWEENPVEVDVHGLELTM